MRDNNKTILVTGATGGIGIPLCEYLSSKNYNLILASRSQEKLDNLKTQLAKHQNDIQTLLFDFSDESSFQLENKNITKLDGLVLMPPQPPPVRDPLPDSKTWEDLFKCSFISPMAFIKKCIPYLAKSNRSKVVVVSGVTSVKALTNYPTSNPIRAALLAQAKLLAIVHGKQNIHFNTISFGLVLTPKYQKLLQKQAQEKGMDFEGFIKNRPNGTEEIPLRKYATPDEAAYAIEGLLSSMTDHMTGGNFLCEGGLVKTY